MNHNGQKLGSQWSRNDILRLLVVLNFHIKTVRMLIGIEDVDEMHMEGEGVQLEQRKIAQERSTKKAELICLAATFISQKFGDGCLSSRIQAKLRSLWKQFGAMNDEHPATLYAYGACTWTLSGIETKYPGILTEVASTVRQMQEETFQTSKLALSQQHSNSTRRSTRLKHKEHMQEVVRCKCGFTHYIACVFCKKCNTWQHAYCYYGTEDDQELPDRHRCDICDGIADKEDTLSCVIDKLTIESSGSFLDDPDKDAQASSSVARGEYKELGPFGLPADSKLFWGPKDSFIQSQMRLCLSTIRRFVLPLVCSGINAGQILERIQLGPQEFVSLIEELHGVRYTTALEQISTRKEGSKLTLGKLLTGLMTSLLSEVTFGNRYQQPDSIEALLLDSIFKRIISQNGIDILSGLKRESILAILRSSDSDNPRLKALHTRQARSLRDECLQLVSHLLPSDQHYTPHSDIAEFGLDDPAQPEIEAIDEALQIFLDLQFRMSISECFYEIYIPKGGTRAIPEMMTDEADSPINHSQECELCLVPGIIEYSKQMFPDRKVVFGENLVVKVSDEERLRGRVASPAIVLLA